MVSLRPGWLCEPQAWLAGPQAWLAGPQAWLAGPEGGTDKRTNVRTYRQKISPFYRTSSPIGPLPKKNTNKKKAELHDFFPNLLFPFTGGLEHPG